MNIIVCGGFGNPISSRAIATHSLSPRQKRTCRHETSGRLGVRSGTDGRIQPRCTASRRPVETSNAEEREMRVYGRANRPCSYFRRNRESWPD
jgi:hypothetical protein